MSWSLRELLCRYQAVQYEANRRTAEIAAALYNVQRTKASDPVWSYLDFHPKHFRPAAAAQSGKAKLAAIAAAMAPDMVWSTTAQKPEVI